MISVSNARKLATWHALAPTSDALIATIMDTSQLIALTKYHPQACQQDAGTTPLVGMTDQHLRVIITPGITTMTIGIGTDSVDLDPTHITLDIGVTVAMFLGEVTLDPFTSLCIIAHHATEAQAHTNCQDTPHPRSSSCRNFSRDDSRSRTHKSNKQHYKTSQKSSSYSQPTPWKPKDRKYKQVTIDDPTLRIL